MNTMKWLVKREFWEHRGGFFWAPVIAACIYVAMSTFAIFVGDHIARHTSEPGEFHMSLVQAIQDASDPAKAGQVRDGVQILFQTIGLMPLVVTVFVIFFYCLSCLYDERKDKSVLFWKSLPISDNATIGSKLLSAMVVAPVIGTLVAIATSLVLLVLASLAVIVLHGQNPIALWSPIGIAKGCATLIATIPVTSLWALPTIGWLMLCSAWARRVPFLWATVTPIVAGMMVWMTGLMDVVHMGTGWFWRNIVGRILGGLVPNIELAYRYHALGEHPSIRSPDDLTAMFSASNILQGLVDPQLWIGAVAGAAMIFVALRLRRWRDEG